MKAFSKRVLSLGLSLAMVASVIAVPSTEAQAATGIAKSKTYYAGQTKTLNLTTSSKWKNVKTTWSTSKKSIVKIAKKTNKTVTINCVKAGKANVTAKVSFKKGTKKYTKKYTCKVTVKNPTFEVSAGKTTLKLGETTAIKVTKKPASAVVKYSSDDAAIAKISGGRITATGIGTTKINARMKIGSQTVARKSVEITVVPSEDGLTTTLANPFTADYPNTVLVNQNAIINVACVRDGKPVAGETMVLTLNKGNYDWAHYEIKGSATATTNSNGIAAFVIGHNTTVKANNVGAKASVNYSISVAGSKEAKEGTVDFAAVTYSKVSILNNCPEDPAIEPVYKDLVPGTNYTELYAAGKGEAKTASMDDPTNTTDEYVESQQVSSADTDEHAVYVGGGYPIIQFPGKATDLSTADKKVEPIDVSYGPYGTYEGPENSKYVTISENPAKLTYAALNFDYLKLSKYTKARIATYVSEEAAKADVNNDNGTWIDQKFFNHEQNQGAFSYQIPLEKDAKCVKITIYSKGQVDTATNGGYKASSIEYVYKKGTADAAYPVKGADVTWSIVDTGYTAEVDLVPTVNAPTTKRIGSCDIDLKKDEKITYKMPRFPYTGTAILTHYDANGKVVSYYAYSTVNNGVNQNVLGQPVAGHNYAVTTINGFEQATNLLADINWTNGKCYKITADELRDKVGTIVTQDGEVAKVNSYQSGRTTLEGKVTVNGKVVEALDAETNTMYTSIQWNPIPMQTAKSAAFVAFVGQNIEVTAQLIDKNGNAVTKDNQNVTFYYTKDNAETAINKSTDVNLTVKDNAGNTLPKISVVNVDTVTDSKGQAKLILKAADITGITDIKAKSTSSQYEVREIIADTNVTSADLYWVEPELVFEDCAVTEPGDLGKVKTSPTNTTNTATGNMNPLSGATWLYGVYSEADNLPDIGVLANKTVKIDGLNIAMAKAAGGVGTVEATTKKGEVKATSIKTGKTTIVSKITSSSVTADTKIIAANAVFAGTGTATINRTLKVEVQWKNNGKTAEMLAPNGTNIVSGNVAHVYVKVTDSNGNPVDDGTRVTLTTDDAGSTLNAAVSANVATVDGIATANLTMGANRVTVTAKVEGISDQTYAITYTKVNPLPADRIAVDFDKDDLTDKYKATFDKTTGEITLVFTRDIIESSVITDGIAAFYGTGTDAVNMGVDTVKVDGNVVTIKVVNVPGTIDAAKDITVRFRTMTVKHVEYGMTADNGSYLGDMNIAFKADGGNTIPRIKTTGLTSGSTAITASWSDGSDKVAP